MAQLLSLKICNKYSTKRFGSHRWCFDFNTPSKPNETGLQPSSVPVAPPPTPPASPAALNIAQERVAAIPGEEWDAIKEARAKRAKLQAQLGLPPMAGDKAAEKPKEIKEKANKIITAEELALALRDKTPKQQQELYLQLAAEHRLDTSTKAYRTSINGEPIELNFINNIGPRGFPLGLNGYTATVLAKMYHGEVPSGYLYNRMYNDKNPNSNIVRVPYFTGDLVQIQKAVNEERKSRGLSPLPFNITTIDKEGRKQIIRSGIAMQSPEFLSAERAALKNYLEENRISDTAFTIGAGKTVFAPDPPDQENPEKISFGGGLHAEAFIDSKTKKTKYKVGEKIVQGDRDKDGNYSVLHHAHEPGYHDIASVGDILMSVKYNGATVPIKEFKENPKYAAACLELFGPDYKLNQGYPYPDWMQAYVDRYHQDTQNLPDVSLSPQNIVPPEVASPSHTVTSRTPASKHPPTGLPEIAEPAKQLVVSSRPTSPTVASAPLKMSSHWRESPVEASASTPARKPSRIQTVSAPVQAGSFAPSSVQQERAAPSQAPTPVHGLERKSVSEQPQIKGSSLLVGDSITEGLAGSVSNPNLNVDGKINTIAKSGRFTSEALEALSDDDGVTLKTEVLEMIRRDNVKNMVLLIGTNDVGGAKSAQDIFNIIEKIWKLGKDAGLNVYACTIPPFKGYAPYVSNFQRINEKRNDLNKLIMGSSTPTQVIKLHERMADPVDKDKMAEKYEREGSPDHLHPSKMALASLYAGEIAQDQRSRGAGEGVRPKPAVVQQPVLAEKSGENEYDIPKTAQVAEVPLAPKSSTSLKPLEPGEFKYGLDGEKPPQRAAKVIETANGQKVIEFELGRVVIQEGDIQTIDQVRSAYKTAEEFEGRGHLAFLLLHLNLKAKRPINSVMTYSFNGINGLARFEIHTDKVRPKPHPGIGMWTK